MLRMLVGRRTAESTTYAATNAAAPTGPSRPIHSSAASNQRTVGSSQTVTATAGRAPPPSHSLARGLSVRVGDRSHGWPVGVLETADDMPGFIGSGSAPDELGKFGSPRNP